MILSALTKNMLHSFDINKIFLKMNWKYSTRENVYYILTWCLMSFPHSVLCCQKGSEKVCYVSAYFC